MCMYLNDLDDAACSAWYKIALKFLQYGRDIIAALNPGNIYCGDIYLQTTH